MTKSAARYVATDVTVVPMPVSAPATSGTGMFVPGVALAAIPKDPCNAVRLSCVHCAPTSCCSPPLVFASPAPSGSLAKYPAPLSAVIMASLSVCVITLPTGNVMRLFHAPRYWSATPTTDGAGPTHPGAVLVPVDVPPEIGPRTAVAEGRIAWNRPSKAPPYWLPPLPPVTYFDAVMAVTA